MSQLTDRDTPTRLVDAAVEAFAAKGFHGTTTRDIATAAGLSSAGLYVHHRSKEDLLYVISREGHERTLQLIRDAVAGSSDPTEQLLAMFRSYVENHARGHTRARIVNYELTALSPEHHREITAMRRTTELEVRAIVDRGVEAGAFRTTNPRMTTVALLSLGIDVGRWYRDAGAWTPTDVADHYCELALRLVGAERPGEGGP